MTDLDALVRAHLADQPPVDVPPVSLVRRRAARRRRALVGSSVLAAAVAVLGAAVVVPTLVPDERRDTVTGPAESDGAERVPPGAVKTAVCPAAPVDGSRRCQYGANAAFAGRLTNLVNGAGSDQSGCRPVDADVSNVRIRLTYADGSTVDLRVDDCMLTVGDGLGRPGVYAPEVSRAAVGRTLTAQDGLIWFPDRSHREGCAAVVEDLEDLLLPPGLAGPARPAQVVELTMAEEHPYLSIAHQELVDDLRPRVNDLLLGYAANGVEPHDALRQGLDRLRATC